MKMQMPGLRWDWKYGVIGCLIVDFASMWLKRRRHAARVLPTVDSELRGIKLIAAKQNDAIKRKKRKLAKLKAATV